MELLSAKIALRERVQEGERERERSECRGVGLNIDYGTYF